MVWNFDEGLQTKRNQQCWFKKLKSWFQELTRTSKNTDNKVLFSAVWKTYIHTCSWKCGSWNWRVTGPDTSHTECQKIVPDYRISAVHVTVEFSSISTLLFFLYIFVLFVFQCFFLFWTEAFHGFSQSVKMNTAQSLPSDSLSHYSWLSSHLIQTVQWLATDWTAKV